MILVTEFDLAEGAVVQVVGPFADEKLAMDWIDAEAAVMMDANPALSLESTEDMVLVSSSAKAMEDRTNNSEESPWGSLFQVMEMNGPEDADEDEPVPVEVLPNNPEPVTVEVT